MRFIRPVQFESIMNENSDEEEFEMNIPTTESDVAAQKQQSDGGSTVQGDGFADRDEARISEINFRIILRINSECLKKDIAISSPVLLHLIDIILYHANKSLSRGIIS